MSSVSQNSNGNRNKELNIIYFFNANKTHSFKMSFRKFIICLSLGSGILVWSICSAFWIYYELKKETILTTRLTTTLNNIFEYQSRYENIYETAYPDQNKQKPENHYSDAAEKIEEKLDKTSSKKNDQAQEKFNSLYESINQSEMEVNLKVVEQSLDWPVKIEDVVLYKEKNSPAYELNFAIRNVKSPLKSDGFIWAVATFVTTKGNKFYVGAPVGITLNEDGKPTEQAKNFEVYNIRYYKAKSLTFIPSSTEKSFMVHIAVGMTDKKSKDSTIFDISVQPEIDTTTLPILPIQAAENFIPGENKK